MRTVHVPGYVGIYSSENHRSSALNFRLVFAAPSPQTIQLSTFDSFDRRTGRLEITFFKSTHLRISWNGRISRWCHGRGRNLLEFSGDSGFKLNGKIVELVDFVEERIQPDLLKLSHDHIATPDDHFLALLSDPEISSFINVAPWQPPLISSELVIPSVAVNKPEFIVDYIVYDESSISSFQISLDNFRGIRRNWLDFNFFNTFISLILPLTTRSALKTQVPSIIFTFCFVLYLAILFRLSRMTSLSLRPKLPSTPQTTPSTMTDLPISTSLHKLTHTTSKSASRTILLDFSDKSQIKSSLSADGTIIKVSVPAAFSLADNRHIIFPSKLRSFQK